MSCPDIYRPGAQWERLADGALTQIVGPGARFRGEAMYLIKAVESGRTRLISISGLLRKYKPLDLESGK